MPLFLFVWVFGFLFSGWMLRDENSTKPSCTHEVGNDQALLAYIYKKGAQFFFCPSYMVFDASIQEKSNPFIEMNDKGLWKVVKFHPEVGFLGKIGGY